MIRRVTTKGVARRLELVATGLRSGRRKLLGLDVLKETNALGEPLETITIEVTRPQRRRPR